MDINKIKILISIAIVVAALGIAYALDFSKWKEINNINGRIDQTNASISAKQNYYSSIDAKMQALTDAGWATKKDSLAINFDSSLFFTPKINNFFKTIVSSSGMTISSITNALPESVKSQPQASTSETEGGAKTSNTEETSEMTIQSGSNYLAQLQGPVRKTTVNLTVTGTYAAFKNLLAQFQGQTRIVTIKSVSVASVTSGEGSKVKTVGNLLSFSIILDVYSY